MNDRYTQPRKQCWWTNTGDLQQFWGIGSPGRKDYLAKRRYVAGRVARALRIANADRPPSLEQHCCCLGSRPDLQIALLGQRFDKGARGPNTPAIFDIALIVPDPRLTCAIVVGIARQSEAVRGVNEGVAQRVPPIAVCDGKRSIRAPVVGIARTASPFGSLEVREHVSVAPAPIAASGPTIEILWIAPVVVHPVDRSRTA